MFKSEEGLLELFQQYAPRLFETSFLMILSSGAKTENFPLLQEMSASEDDQVQINLNTLMEITLNVCS